MPHLVIHCSENVIQMKPPSEILSEVHEANLSTKLFIPENIKVRIIPFNHYLNGGIIDDFVHVFANIMKGRDETQKKELSNEIASRLRTILPHVPFISVNIVDMEQSTYSKKTIT